MSIISYNVKAEIGTELGLLSDDEVMSIYESWMPKQGKSYNALGEKDKRFENFKDNLRYIDEHNTVVNRTFMLGLNPFASLSNDEYMKDISRHTTQSITAVSDRYPVEFIQNDKLLLIIYVGARCKGHEFGLYPSQHSPFSSL